MKNIAILAALAISTVGLGQIDRSVRPKAKPAPQINIQNSQSFELPNGLTVILSENHKIPKVSFSLYIGSDPILEANKAGLSNFAGNMMMSGTKSRDKDQLDKEIDYIGARINASANSLSLSCLTKHLNKGLDLMTDVLYNPSFPESEFDRLKKQEESGLKAVQASADAMVANAVQKTLFPVNHPYNSVMTEESLNNIKLEDIKMYHQQLFIPKGAYLVVVGDINLDKTKELVNKYFKDWKGGQPFKMSNPQMNSPKSNEVVFVKKPGAVQSVIRVCFPVDIQPGDEDQIKLSVLNNVLGGGAFGNRLMSNLREDKAYTYGCRSALDIDELGSYFYTTGSFRNEVTDSSITEILKELKNITEEYVTDDELNLTKSSMAGLFALSLENPSTIARFALNIKKYNLPSDYYQTYLQKLEAVNKEDILLMAQKYLQPNRLNVVVAGNEDIVGKLVPFDNDGKITRLDAFGNEVKEIKPADLTADQVIEKYVLVTTASSSMKEAQKKLKKIKSVKKEFDLSAPQIPIPLKMTEIWMEPNMEAVKMEGQGMVFQKEYFDGTTGGSTSMQTGKKALSAQDIAAKKKSVGLLPELNYKTSGMDYKILGIEEVAGTPMYVIQTKDGKAEKLAYYRKDNFMKTREISTETEDGETVTSEVNYSDFKNINGVQFPHQVVLSVGPMTLTGKISSIEVNSKVDIEPYK